MARILMIDDNADILAMMSLVLKRKGGHEVTTIANGVEGLETALRGEHDLLIVDVMMPDISGYEIVQRLREAEATAKMPIIILSARGQPIDKRTSETVGADLHLSKPVDAVELLQEVERLLQRRAEGPSRHKLIVLFSLRGGIGKTTLAVNLALLLQRVAPTTLVDLTTNGGHCATMLGVRPHGEWSALRGQATTTMTTQQLAALMTPHASGLNLLAAPSSPLRCEELLSAEETTALLTAATARTPLVVVDLPARLDPATLTALELASRILLIGGLYRPDLETTIQTLPFLAAWKGKVSLVLNSPTPAPPLKKEQVERVVRHPVAMMLPYHTSAATALLRSRPLVEEAPQSPLAQALRYLTRLALS